jgi:ectoine hydroxylase-related dioxygenase (phytanoyl-CoA dioxygenase family)
MVSSMTTTSTALVTDELVARYRRDGVVAVRDHLSREAAADVADAALTLEDRIADYHQDATFTQLIDAWRVDERLRRVALDPALAAAAERLAGVPLRLWHDQVLIKPPHNRKPTEFHQDQPYWPHAGARATITAWIALVDVPVERGCMTFIPGSQRRRDLPEQDLLDAGSLFALAPDLIYEERLTYPLRAGSLTFHDGRTAHTANANATDEPRVAFAVIYIDAEAQYSGAPHPVTDGLGLTAGAPLPDDRFPRPAG